MFIIYPELRASAPGEAITSISVSGDIITVNDQAYDLSAIPEGAIAEPQGDHPFVGNIERKNGDLHVRVQWVFDPVNMAPVQPSPTPAVSISGGAVSDPVLRQVEANV